MPDEITTTEPTPGDGSPLEWGMPVTQTTGLDWALLDRIKNRARELCRLADGSPCSGPDTDCDPSNCHAMERADMECRKP